jgi:hypothetical protein
MLNSASLSAYQSLRRESVHRAAAQIVRLWPRRAATLSCSGASPGKYVDCFVLGDRLLFPSDFVRQWL